MSGLAGSIILLIAALAAPAAAAKIAAGVKVYPVKINLTAEPGRPASTRFSVVNTAGTPADVDITIKDFVRDEQGRYRFLAPGRRPDVVSTARWTRLSPSEFRLAPGETRKVDVGVTPAKGAGPGGHFAMIFVTADPVVDRKQAPDPGIIGRARVGVMVRATVKGKVVDEAGFERLEVPRVSLGGPVKMTLVFSNHGNIHKDIAGIITLSKGAVEVARLPVDEWTSLPGSTLRIDRVWSRPRLGVYEVTARIASRDGEDWTKKAPIYVIPIRAAVVVLIAVLALVLGWRFIAGRYTVKMEKK